MYYKLAEKNLDVAAGNFTQEVENSYHNGFLLGRIRPGYMVKTRSLRVDLSKFKPNSENRRILRKFPEGDIMMLAIHLPISEIDYSWRVHKLGKDFYKEKFNETYFSAVKIREILRETSSFNTLFAYGKEDITSSTKSALETAQGFAIAYQSQKILHYAYPFYELSNESTNNMGMYMMLQVLLYCQMHGISHCYLGGATRPEDKYKLQFSGLEWHDGTEWQDDLSELKQLLTSV